jgi:CHASE2 domain-containing sensor protein
LIAGWSLIGGVIVWRIRLLPGQGCAIVATVIVLYGTCAAILLIQGVWLPFIPSAFAVIVNGTTVLVLKQSHKDVN